MSATEELIKLRVSLARIAQALQCETEKLPVLDKCYSELVFLAIANERGWNQLACACVEQTLPFNISTNQELSDVPF